MAQLDIPLGYTLFATTEVTAFKQRCINEAEEQAKKKYLHAVTERDTVIANASSYVEKLLKEKSDLERRVAFLEDENKRLSVKVNGLEEETSDAASNLQDAITTNDALIEQVKKLELERQACTCKSGAPVMVAWDSTTDTIHDPKPLDKVSEIQSSPVDIQSSSAVTLNLIAKNCSHLNFNVGIVTIRKRFQASQTLYCHATDKISGSDEVIHCFSDTNLYVCLRCGSMRCESHVPGHAAKHHNRYPIYVKMPSLAVWCSICQCEIPSDYLTSDIKECQKVLQGKGLTLPTKTDMAKAGIIFRKDAYNKKSSTSTIKPSVHGDQRVDVPTASPPAQVSIPKSYQFGVPRAPSPRPSLSSTTKHLLPSASTSAVASHNSVKHLPPSDGKSSHMTVTATTTTKPSSSSQSTISVGSNATAWRTTTVESSIVPVSNTLSPSHIDRTKPSPANELNNPNHNETENAGYPTSSFSRKKNPKSLILKNEVLPNKPKFSTSTQQTNSSSNPIKPVHPSTIPMTAIFDYASKPADKEQTPSTYASYIDRRPATPPPYRPNSSPSTTMKMPSTPPAPRRYLSPYTFDYYGSSSSNYPVKGLRNVGLTCYFNAALQCLSRIPKFENLLSHLIQGGQRIPLKIGNEKEIVIKVSQPHGQVSKVLSETIDEILSYKNGEWTDFLGSLNPSNLLKEIRHKYTNFQPNRPCDSHEVMRCILDAVRMEEIKKVKTEVSNHLLKDGVSATFVDGEANLNHKAALRSAHKHKTYIDEVVGGELLSVVVCLECRHRAELIEPFLDISVPIPEYNTISKTHTLEECLLTYTKWDILDDENMFICTKCSKQVGDVVELKRAMKQLTLKRIPPVLILHLKRFHIGIVVTKNSTPVQYPKHIDVRQYCIETTGRTTSTKYSLFAVVEHTGTLNFGHYVAYVKVSNEWYKADDSIVTKVESRYVLSREAYLLFYQQEN